MEKTALNAFVNISRSDTEQGKADFYGGIEDLEGRKSVLLHSCCGPCSTACIERLSPDYDVTVFYFNPCITEVEEYERRKANQIKFIQDYNRDGLPTTEVKFIEGDYDPKSYLDMVKGYEQEPEGGLRCSLCFRQRLMETARRAAELGMDYFTTTLTVSPHKNYEVIKTIALEASNEYGVEFLDIDFKKKAGFQRSIQLSKEYDLYRQDYCGCRFSKR